MNDTNKSGTNKYRDIFIEVLKKELENPETAQFSFKKELKEIEKDDFNKMFPNKAIGQNPNKDWLNKELFKWNQKIKSGTFNPTLQNLCVFCELTKKSPNEVLKINNDFSNLTKIEFLDYDALDSLCKHLSSLTELKQTYSIPILYAPDKMVIAFIIIFSRKINNINNIYVRFVVSAIDDSPYTEGTGKEEKITGGMINYPVVSPKEINLTNPAKNVINPTKDATKSENQYNLCTAYQQMKQEFTNAYNDLSSMITNICDDFVFLASKLSSEANKLIESHPLLPHRETPESEKTYDEQVNKTGRSLPDEADNQR